MLLSAPAALGQEAAAPAPQVIADFDRVTPDVSVTGELRLGEAAEDGNRLARLRGGGARGGQVLYELPEDARPGESGGVSFRARAVGSAADVWLVAADARGRVILLRRLKIQPSDRLHSVALPWTRWRWGPHSAGPPGEVRRVGLQFQAGVAELLIDDLALTAPQRDAGAATGKEWLRQVAFGGGDVRMAEADGLLVITDAVEGPEQLTEADLTRILGRMRAARKFVRRVFGDAVRPVAGPVPPSLLIFREQADLPKFWESVGTEWNVSIRLPTAGGYTVQTLAATTFDPKQGADRPVFLHESVHAVMAEDVRLFTGHNRHSWLHEGTASYVQLCVYPRSIDRRELAAKFRRPIPADGSGFFKPLGILFAPRVVAGRQYAQLGTLVAYLIEQKPRWLPILARELAHGATAEAAFEKCGTTLPDLQDAWMKWGAEKVGADSDAGAMLAVPEEFAALQDAAPPPK